MLDPNHITPLVDLPATERSAVTQMRFQPGQAVVREVNGQRASQSAEAIEMALVELQELAGLATGWDSYGADPPAPVALARAAELLRTIHQVFGRYVGDKTSPEYVAPRADGGVQIEWGEHPLKVSVEVTAHGGLGYLLVDWRSGARMAHEHHGVEWETLRDVIARVVFAA